MKNTPFTYMLVTLLAFVVAGCAAGDPRPSVPTGVPPGREPMHAAAQPTAVPAARSTPTAAPAASPVAGQPAAGELRIATEGSLPDGGVAAALDLIRKVRPDAVAADDNPDLVLSLTDTPDDSTLVYERVMVPVDRFSTILDSISFAELQGAWSGKSPSANFATIYPSEDALPDLRAVLGPPGDAVKPQPRDKVADAVWGDRMGIGIVPFDELIPRERALGLDGLSTIDNRLTQSKWPLATRIWLAARSKAGEAALTAISGLKPVSNRDPARLTVLAVTGTTALTRHTAIAIDRNDDDAWPARLVGPELAAADLTTISNEVSFVADCEPSDDKDNVMFCSKPEYLAALQLSGVDAIGLTGNHMNDYGYDAFYKTLNFYRDKGIPVYGGGADDEAAARPLILENHGNRVAFLGANQYGPETYWAATGEELSAWAGPQNPGAARFDREQMVAAIQALKPQVDLVFAEMQYTEFNDAGEYEVTPLPSQVVDFQALSDAGADVVTGVQSHTPQALALRGQGVILYGLGNLYFDQATDWATRTGLVARHIIYDHRLLGTELLVTVIDPNMQVRWATPEERASVLKSVFAASGW